jgi:transposase
LIRRARIPTASEVAPELRALGVDDVAFRRGRDYGAILVDLDQQRVLDRLPDRDAATFAHWLEQHGGAQVKVVSRDRGGAFADGVRQAAPHAAQVADRFHLLQHRGQALDQFLTRAYRVLTRVADTLNAAKNEQAAESETSSSEAPPLPMTRLERAHAAVEARRQGRYQRVLARAGAGHALREVARRTGLRRGTVRRDLQAAHYQPGAQPARRAHACDALAASLPQRWEAGAPNRAALGAEIQAHGFTGAASTVRQDGRGWRTGRRHAGRRRRGEDAGGKPRRHRHSSPRQTRRILLRPVDELDADERASREALCQERAAMAHAQTLAADLGRIVREHAHPELEAWLTAASHSRVSELVSCARGLRRDLHAVMAALRSPYSQGQTEGHVNRLKMLTRQTYGRASFDQLRRQVLYHAV